MQLTTAQRDMLVAIAKGAELKLDPKAFSVLYHQGLVAINAPGQRLVSVTQTGLDLIATQNRDS